MNCWPPMVWTSALPPAPAFLPNCRRCLLHLLKRVDNAIPHRPVEDLPWQNQRETPLCSTAGTGSFFEESDAVSPGAHMGADDAAQAVDGQILLFRPQVRLLRDELLQVAVV